MERQQPRRLDAQGLKVLPPGSLLALRAQVRAQMGEREAVGSAAPVVISQQLRQIAGEQDDDALLAGERRTQFGRSACLDLAKAYQQQVARPHGERSLGKQV